MLYRALYIARLISNGIKTYYMCICKQIDWILDRVMYKQVQRLIVYCKFQQRYINLIRNREQRLQRSSIIITKNPFWWSIRAISSMFIDKVYITLKKYIWTKRDPYIQREELDTLLFVDDVTLFTNGTCCDVKAYEQALEFLVQQQIW